MRQEFEMTDEEYKELQALSKDPVTIGYLSNSQENANHFWKRLGDKYGFHWLSARPKREGENKKIFTAVKKQA